MNGTRGRGALTKVGSSLPGEGGDALTAMGRSGKLGDRSQFELHLRFDAGRGAGQDEAAGRADGLGRPGAEFGRDPLFLGATVVLDDRFCKTSLPDIFD